MRDAKPKSETFIWEDFVLGLGQGGYLLLAAAALLPPLLLLPRGIWALLQASGRDHAFSPLADWGDLAGNTLVVAGVGTFGALVLSVPLAILLTRLELPLRSVIWFALLALACLPLYATTTAWVDLFTQAWLIATPIRQILAAGLIMGLAYAPLATLVVAAGVRAVPAELEEAARLEGPAWKVLLGVTLPQCAWSVLGAGLLVFVLACTEITVTDALWTRTYAEEIFVAFQRTWDVGHATVTAWPLAGLILLGVLLLRPFFARLLKLPLGRKSIENRRVLLPSPSLHVLAGLLLIIQGLMYIYPLAHLLYKGVQPVYATNTPQMQQNSRPVAPESFGSDRSAELPAATIWQRLGLSGTSAILAGAGALLAVSVAAPLAWMMNRGGHALRWLLWGMTIYLLALPGPLTGMALIGFWNLPGGLSFIRDSAIMLPLYYCVRFLPVAILILYGAFSRLPGRYIDSARLDGAGQTSILFRVALPLSIRALVAAWLVAYVLALADVGGTVVVAPPGLPLFAVRYATLIHFSTSYPELARMALMPVVFALTLGGALFALLLRWRHEPWRG